MDDTCLPQLFTGPNAARNLTMVLCHYDGIPTSLIAENFGLTRRWVNAIIANMKKTVPCVEAAFHTYKEIKTKLNQERIKEILMIDETITPLEAEVLPTTEDLTPAARLLSAQTEAARVAANLKAKSKQIKSLTLQVGKLKYENIRLKERVAEILEERDSHETLDAESSTRESDLIDEMVDLRNINKHARRYSERMLRFAYVLYTLSPRAYKFAKSMLIIPSRSKVFTKYSGLTKEIKSSSLMSIIVAFCIVYCRSTLKSRVSPSTLPLHPMGCPRRRILRLSSA